MATIQTGTRYQMMNYEAYNTLITASLPHVDALYVQAVEEKQVTVEEVNTKQSHGAANTIDKDLFKQAVEAGYISKE
jgi:hypothetical protein